MNMRVIALDVGDVRIGVAVSDPTGTIAQPLEVYRRVGYAPDGRYVQALCEKYQTDQVLLGLPLNMDGSLGPQAQKAQAFGQMLAERHGLRIFYQDERMTTVTAEQVLIGGNVRREDRRQYVDKLAAAVILEQWLASQSRQKEEDNGRE